MAVYLYELRSKHPALSMQAKYFVRRRLPGRGWCLQRLGRTFALRRCVQKLARAP